MNRGASWDNIRSSHHFFSFLCLLTREIHSINNVHTSSPSVRKKNISCTNQQSDLLIWKCQSGKQHMGKQKNKPS